MEREAIVKISRQCIKMTVHMSNLETKWMVLALYLRDNKTEFEVNLHEVYEYFGVGSAHRGGQQWASIREAIVSMEEVTNGWMKSSINKNTISVSFNDADGCLENPEVEVDLSSILSLKSKYGPKLLLWMYYQLGEKKTCRKNWSLNHNELEPGVREYLGVDDKYKLWGDFNKRVIIPAFEDIDSNCKTVKVKYQPYNYEMLKNRVYDSEETKSRQTIIGIRTSIRRRA